MAIQNRRGKYADFDPAKMKPGEFAIVQEGDPGASGGMAVYMAFAAGVFKRLITDMDLQKAIEDLDLSDGGATPEQISAAVDRYLAEHPPSEVEIATTDELMQYLELSDNSGGGISDTLGTKLVSVKSVKKLVDQLATKQDIRSLQLTGSQIPIYTSLGDVPSDYTGLFVIIGDSSGKLQTTDIAQTEDTLTVISGVTVTQNTNTLTLA